MLSIWDRTPMRVSVGLLVCFVYMCVCVCAHIAVYFSYIRSDSAAHRGMAGMHCAKCKVDKSKQR